jgi:hypothetical protein
MSNCREFEHAGTLNKIMLCHTTDIHVNTAHHVDRATISRKTHCNESAHKPKALRCFITQTATTPNTGNYNIWKHFYNFVFYM